MPTIETPAADIEQARQIIRKQRKARRVRSESSPEYVVTRPAASNPAEDQIIAQALEILARRMARGELIGGPSSAGDYLRMKYAAQPFEVFGAIMLDTRHRIIEILEIAHGTIDSCTVHPREVLRAVMACNAAAVIIFHNHPSGNPQPSEADQFLTRRISETLAHIDARVLDHVVVAAGGFCSFAERGINF